MISILYEDSDIFVRANIDHVSGPIVVTFSPHGYRDFENGWGESFFSRRGVDGVYVVSRTNSWFQVPGMSQACHRIKEAIGQDRQVVTYGSSMGGHAALVFSEILGASRVLAFSPQFGIRGFGGTPWTKQWYSETKGQENLYTMDIGLSRTAEVYVVYDPLHGFDFKHIRRISHIRPIDAIRAPFTGHNTTSAMSRLGVLSDIVVGVVEGPAKVENFRRTVRAARKNSLSNILYAAEVLDARCQGSLRDRVVQEHAFSAALPIINRGESVAELRAVMEIMISRIGALWVNGDVASASYLSGVLLDKYPKSPYGHTALKLTSALKGDWEAALISARRALRLAKRDLYRRMDVVLLSLKNGDISQAEYHAGVILSMLHKVASIKMDAAYVSAFRSFDLGGSISELSNVLTSSRVKRRKAPRSSVLFLSSIGPIPTS